MANETGNWVRIMRTFDAPIEEVWDMWTKPELFQKWYGPMGMTVPSAEMDLVVGGARRISMEMQTPERTMTMYFTGAYTRIEAPSTLAYTEAMCDADGTLIPPSAMGMPEGTPDTTEVVVELSSQDGKTVMVMTHTGVPAGSPGEGGWNQAFDKLAATFG